MTTGPAEEISVIEALMDSVTFSGDNGCLPLQHLAVLGELAKRGAADHGALVEILALLDKREAEHAEVMEKIRTGEIISLDRAVGPPTIAVSVLREVVERTLGVTS